MTLEEAKLRCSCESRMLMMTNPNDVVWRGYFCCMKHWEKLTHVSKRMLFVSAMEKELFFGLLNIWKCVKRRKLQLFKAHLFCAVSNEIVCGVGYVRMYFMLCVRISRFSFSFRSLDDCKMNGKYFFMRVRVSLYGSNLFCFHATSPPPPFPAQQLIIAHVEQIRKQLSTEIDSQRWWVSHVNIIFQLNFSSFNFSLCLLTFSSLLFRSDLIQNSFFFGWYPAGVDDR